VRSRASWWKVSLPSTRTSGNCAITGAVPLLYYLALVVCSRVLERPIHLWLGVILLGPVLTSTVFITKTLLDNYSLVVISLFDLYESLMLLERACVWGVTFSPTWHQICLLLR
jgi:hypothetical protein